MAPYLGKCIILSPHRVKHLNPRSSLLGDFRIASDTTTDSSALPILAWGPRVMLQLQRCYHAIAASGFSGIDASIQIFVRCKLCVCFRIGI
ncbi:hypothetical protein CDAR_585751 [Caerostris darwini]|uniref:Uncharacterized protein n=1 Tax=Caerostris darwini TaxID=1538125 RepID=A0AAV4TNS9_9ARAC|nr:hypothetical protein CDAR_585751 [Caerostris darwini]